MSRTMSELQIWYGSQSGGTKRRNRVIERWRFTFDFGKGAKKAPPVLCRIVAYRTRRKLG